MKKGKCDILSTMNSAKITQFISLSKPILLLGIVGQILLGAGISNYLGNSVDLWILIQGELWAILVALAAMYLDYYFRYDLIFLGSEEGLEKPERKTFLTAFITVTTFAGGLTLSLLLMGAVNWISGILMLVIFVGGIFYSVPPFQLVNSGLGEFAAAIGVGYLFPALGYGLQTGDSHRLVSIVSIPIILLVVVYAMATSLSTYASDLKRGRNTLLARVGWENGLVLHNSMLLLAYVIFAASMFMGAPRRIILPEFITLPLGILQIWQMRQIADGGKPNWKALSLTATALIGTTIYLLTFSFWVR